MASCPSCRLVQFRTEAASLDCGLDWGTLKQNLVIPSNGSAFSMVDTGGPDQDGYFLNTVGSKHSPMMHLDPQGL